jgi:16S rRNA C1402 N4-methylase RsmH
MVGQDFVFLCGHSVKSHQIANQVASSRRSDNICKTAAIISVIKQSILECSDDRREICCLCNIAHLTEVKADR